MWRLQFRWLVLLLTFLSLTACVNNTTPYQRTVVLRPGDIVTPVPAPREIVVVPAHYVNCKVVQGRWIYSTWIPEHRVCYYTGNPTKVTWVDGYWVCTKHVHMKGQCKHWSWRSATWYDRVVYY